MTYRRRHQAICSKCRSVAEESDRGTFIDPFFLPRMCASCGEIMQTRWPVEERPHWRHAIIKEVWVEPVRTRNLLTWFRQGAWSEVERSEFPA